VVAQAVLSQQAAAQELLNRRKARAALLAFTQYTNPAYQAAPHHRLIAEKLEAVERGEIKRLMITMPPRHGKSELASRRFPAWYVGRNAGKQIIAASYNSDLANDFGREVRNIVAQPRVLGAVRYADWRRTARRPTAGTPSRAACTSRLVWEQRSPAAALMSC
jgi:hypothetical protein